MIVSGHPAEAGELDAEESAQPMKDVQHNPGDAPHTGVNLEKSRLVGGKEYVWKGREEPTQMAVQKSIFPQRCQVIVESNLYFFNVKFLQHQTTSFKLNSN